MERKLGMRIARFRRAKNMTQEELAGAIGVSAPAVSKWETGSCWPDAALLCPLARALDTDLNTLFDFEDTLSGDEIRDIGGRLRDMIFAGQGKQAEEELTALLRTYPSDIVLKISAISIYSMLSAVEWDSTEKDRDRWKSRKRELAEWIYERKDPNYHRAAISMLIAILLEENELERVEELLREEEKPYAEYVDLSMHRASLHLKRGEKELAVQTLERRKTLAAGDLLNALIGLLREDMEPDRKTILQICEQMQEIERMFGIENPSFGYIYAESYIRAGEYEKAMDYLKSSVQNEKPEMKPVLMQALLNEAVFDPIRDQTEFQKILAELEKDMPEKRI